MIMTAAEQFYSIEQVALQLGLHVRTVRNYVRDGRLKGVRIGKQYRIAREDLESLTGRRGSSPSNDVEPPRQRRVEVSSVVQVDAIAPDAANRITNALMATAQGRSSEDGPLRIDTIY